MRTAHRVVNVAGHGFGQAPFVPDMSTVDAAPEMNVDNIALKNEKRYMTNFSTRNLQNRAHTFFKLTGPWIGNKIGNQENMFGECVAGLIDKVTSL
jgi:hypothetical protein